MDEKDNLQINTPEIIGNLWDITMEEKEDTLDVIEERHDEIMDLLSVLIADIEEKCYELNIDVDNPKDEIEEEIIKYYKVIYKQIYEEP
jgi:hypothetical protein